MTKFAACVRIHGLPNFPDPPYHAGELKKLGYTQTSPQMQRANQQCQALLAAGGASQAQVDQQYLKIYLEMAKCMHAHGIANFPDPTAQGRLYVPEAVYNDSGYQAAAKACGAPSPPPASYWQSRKAGPK